MGDSPGNSIQQVKVNLRMIEAMRTFLADKLDQDDMGEFDNIWNSLMNDSIVDGDPTDVLNANDGASLGAAMQAIRQAEIDVRPVIGEIAPQRSAAAVYKLAFDSMGVNVKGVPASNYGTVFRSMRRHRAADAGGAPMRANDSRGPSPFLANLLQKNSK